MRSEQTQAIELIEKLAVGAFSIIMMMMCSNTASLKYLGVYIIAISIVYMIKLRKNTFTLIVGAFLAWFNYSIIFANYFSKIDSFFLTDAYNEVSITGLRILCIFITILYLFTDYNFLSQSGNTSLVFHSDSETNSILALAYIIILVFILLYGFARPTVSGERGSPSTIYEYSICFFIVGYYYFGSTKWYLNVSTFLLFLFTIQNLMYGGRVTALQELIIFFVLFVNKSLKPNYKIIIPLCCIGLVLFTAIGISRANFTFSYESFLVTINCMKESGLSLDTSYAAFFCSLTFIKTESILSFFQRLIIFFNWVISQFLGGSFVPNSNVASITRQYYVHSFGGVLPFFGHFYFGYLGVCLFSFLPLVYINKLSGFSQQKGVAKCILFYFVVTTPRWYLYSPSPLIRGCFLTFVLYYFTTYIDKLLKKKTKLICDR